MKFSSHPGRGKCGTYYNSIGKPTFSGIEFDWGWFFYDSVSDGC